MEDGTTVTEAPADTAQTEAEAGSVPVPPPPSSRAGRRIPAWGGSCITTRNTGASAPTSLDFGGGTSDFQTTSAKQPIILDDILPVVLAEYWVSRAEFLGPGRHPRVVQARESFVWLVRKLTVMSYPDIAKYCGRLTLKGVPSHCASVHQYRRANAKYLAGTPDSRGRPMNEVLDSIRMVLLEGRKAI